MEIQLRKLSISDTSNIVAWRNAPDVKKNLYSQEDITEEQHLNYFHKYIETSRVVQFIIVADGVDCGTTFLKKIDYDNKEAEYGIFIGIPNYRGRGVSTIVTKKMIEYAFLNLNLK